MSDDEAGDAGSGLKAEDFNMDTGAAGAAHTYPSEAGQIRKGAHIVIKGRPCKVVNVSTSKTGKNGHAKCNFTAIDIFTGKKLEDIVPSSHTAYVPNVTRIEYTLLDINDEDFMSLMDDGGDSREDLKVRCTVLAGKHRGSERRAGWDISRSCVVTETKEQGGDAPPPAAQQLWRRFATRALPPLHRAPTLTSLSRDTLVTSSDRVFLPRFALCCSSRRCRPTRTTSARTSARSTRRTRVA